MGCDKNIAKRAGIEDCVEDIVNHNEDIGDQVVNKLVDCGVGVWTMKWVEIVSRPIGWAGQGLNGLQNLVPPLH